MLTSAPTVAAALRRARPGAVNAARHCAVCCPNTTNTTENSEKIDQGTTGGPTPPVQAADPVTVTAACPLPLNDTDPRYNSKCKKDNTTSYQYGGTCKVECTDPNDYVLITPVETTYQTGCSYDGVQTTCSYVATNVAVINPANVDRPGPFYQRYMNSCTVTAIAHCCKQTCPILPPHHPHHKEEHKEYKEPYHKPPDGDKHAQQHKGGSQYHRARPIGQRG